MVTELVSSIRSVGTPRTTIWPATAGGAVAGGGGTIAPGPAVTGICAGGGLPGAYAAGAIGGLGHGTPVGSKRRKTGPTPISSPGRSAIGLAIGVPLMVVPRLELRFSTKH